MATGKDDADPRKSWKRDLGVRIKELRSRLGHTPGEFAAHLNASVLGKGIASATSVRRWENGGAAPGAAAWESIARIARTKDLEFYLTGISRRDQYAETFANEEFLPPTGFLVLLEVRATDDKKSRVGAFEKVLGVITRHEGRIIRMTTWGEPRDKAQHDLLVLFELPRFPEKSKRPTDVVALRDEIAALDVVARSSLQLRSRDAITLPPSGTV